MRPGRLSLAIAIPALSLSACATVETAPRAIVVTGKVQTKLVIGKSGRPQKCLILVSSGDEAFDRTTCRAQIAQTRYAPALDDAGKRIRRVAVSSVSAPLPDGTLATPDEKKPEDGTLPDFIFLVSTLPDGRISTAAQVEVHVDATGAMRDCHPAPKEKDRELADVACGSLSAVWKTMPEQDDRGAAFPYVRAFQVELRHKS